MLYIDCPYFNNQLSPEGDAIYKRELFYVYVHGGFYKFYAGVAHHYKKGDNFCLL
jgi:hypothetical protein